MAWKQSKEDALRHVAFAATEGRAWDHWVIIGSDRKYEIAGLFRCFGVRTHGTAVDAN